MSTVTVTHTIKNGADDAVAGVKVTVKLSEPGYRSDDSSIRRVETYFSNSSGVVSMELERNQDIVPGGSATYYIATIEMPAKYGGSERVTFRATASQSLRDSQIAA